MAQTNFTPILLYASSTPTNVPLAANLTNSATGSEIAINVADKNLFFKDSTNAVNTVPIRQSSTSSNGWLSSTDWNTFNNKSNTNGTVTSVAALTLGTTGTDLSSTVATGTTTPVITLNVPTASATNRGALSAADWTTFNNKGSGTVTSVAATVPAFLSVSGSPITTNGTLAISYSGTALPVANGGTGLTTLTANYIPYGNGTSALNSSANLTFDGTTLTTTAATVNNAGASTVLTIGGNTASTVPEIRFKMNSATRYNFQIGIGTQANDAFTITPSTAIGGTTFTTAAVTVNYDGTAKVLSTLGVGNTAGSTSGAGITFPATQSASSDANTLDDYEEGTFTPTFNAAITGTSSASGKYTKIGRLVKCTCTVVYTGLTGSTVIVSGLPFTNGSIRQATVVTFWGGSDADTANAAGIVVEATDTLFYAYPPSGASYSGASRTAHFSCWYQV